MGEIATVVLRLCGRSGITRIAAKTRSLLGFIARVRACTVIGISMGPGGWNPRCGSGFSRDSVLASRLKSLPRVLAVVAATADSPADFHEHRRETILGVVRIGIDFA